ncbi:MAG: hypothetical protein MI754_09440 [Chromatiales bacterium]|nr:hypothetical protein [Chromatiales bacterium]
MEISAFNPHTLYAPTQAKDTAETNNQINPKNSEESDSSQQPNKVSKSEESNQQGLTPEEQKKVEELKKRDREVRAHEQAHLAAGGQYTTGVSYEYERGPDGHSYAVGGEVGIDTSPVPGDPEATLEKAEVVRRAALAPAEPSPQDRQVAADAAAMATEARVEIMKQRQHGGGETTEGKPLTNSQSLDQRLAATGAMESANDIGNINLFA